MANITLSVQSFLNAATNLSITIDNAQTVAQLKTAINGQEGTPTAIMDLFLNGTKLTDATTLSASGLISGSYVKTSNNLTEAGTWTKQQRQEYKLQLAQLRRQAAGNTTANYYRENNTYDLTLLPDTYNGNVPGADNNANVGGLLQGRPWLNVAGITFAANIWRTDYEGYFNDVPSFFNTAALKAAPNDYNGTDTTISEPSLLNNTSIQYKGYFLATYTGTHTFYLNSDDGSYLWIGLIALSGYTTANALVQNGGLHALSEVSATINLVAGTYYPIRIQFGNGPSGPGQLFASYAHSGQAKTSTWTGKVFYNTATNGF
jgi:hypothetical protein